MKFGAFPTLRRGGRLCAAVSAVRRAADAAHPLRVLSARCAAGAELFFDFTGGAVFCGNTATVLSVTYFFLSCQKKVCKKEAQDAKIALTRKKAYRYILRIIVTLQVKERPSGDRQIGFPERTVNHANRSVSAR